MKFSDVCNWGLSMQGRSRRHECGVLTWFELPSTPLLLLFLLAQLLAEHNVSAVLSGHLHGSFGQRLHRLHSTPAGGYMAELETAAWKDDRRFRYGRVLGTALDGGAGGLSACRVMPCSSFTRQETRQLLQPSLLSRTLISTMPCCSSLAHPTRQAALQGAGAGRRRAQLCGADVPHPQCTTHAGPL